MTRFKPVLLLLYIIIIISCFGVLSSYGVLSSGYEMPNENTHTPKMVENAAEPTPTITPQPTETPIKYLDRVDGWTCFDYSIEFTQQNPDWGLVVISDDSRFYGDNHLVDYKITDDKKLLIHDELSCIERSVTGWQYEYTGLDYYHFYINGEQPTRQYQNMLPNAEAVYNEL